MKYFKLVHAQIWQIPHYMKWILFICTRQEAFGIFNNFCLSGTLLCLVWYIFFLKKKRWFFMNYFKFVHAPTWKIPYYMTGFLSICTRQEALGIFNMPLLERFLIIWHVFYSYEQGKKHSVSSTIFLYLRLSYALYGTFFGKRWFFMKYFKLVQAPTWKIPYYMTGFLSICTRHKAFGIFNNFPLSATPSYPVRYIFLEKDEFLMKYFKLVHAPSWKIPQYMKIYLFICTRHREFGIFNFFALSATP